MKVSILIATYGEGAWAELAWSRAFPSAVGQGAHEVLVEHFPRATLAESRNALAAEATGDWLLFCDADDELAPGYLDALASAYESLRRQPPHPASVPEEKGALTRLREAGMLALLVPAISYSAGGKRERPRYWKEISLEHGNWLPIGTALPRLLFEYVGGFRERAYYEDYELWARCWLAGAELIKVPAAVYIADWRANSRNKRGTPEDKVRAHFEIGRELFPHIYDDAWLARHLRGGYRAHGRRSPTKR